MERDLFDCPFSFSVPSCEPATAPPSARLQKTVDACRVRTIGRGQVSLSAAMLRNYDMHWLPMSGSYSVGAPCSSSLAWAHALLNVRSLVLGIGEIAVTEWLRGGCTPHSAQQCAR